MNRYRQTGPLDDAPEVIGDTAFNALDLRTDGVLLPPGTARASENFRFTPEGAQVREGLARQFAPAVFCPRILHAGLYRPESGPVRLAFVTYRSLVLVNPSDQTATEVPFPTGESVAKGDPVDFVQAGESDSSTRYAWILRGLDKDALKFDGDEIAVDANFKRGEFGLYAGGRIAVNDTSQSLAVSDFLAYGAANWSLLKIFKILKGADDYLVGLLPYQQFTVIASRQRFHLAYFDPKLSVSGGPGESFLRHMTQEGGCVGRRALFLAGGKVWFVSDHGIYVFQPQLDLQLVLLGEPISAPLEPVMARLNGAAAAGAGIGRYRHRLYFALPINGEAIRLSSLTITAQAAQLTVPFTLPATLGAQYLVEATTATAHNFVTGDSVLVSGLPEAALNGERTVVAVPSATEFTFVITASAAGSGLARATVQKLAERNNTIAVFNLANGAWESLDSLPANLAADFLLTAELGPVSRLWLVDRDEGPFLYEQGETDETGEALGGLRLPFTLPAELSLSSFESAAIRGRFASRTLRWGADTRHVKAGSARLECAEGDAGAITLTVRSPNMSVWTASKNFDDARADAAPRLRCGRRGLEASIEVTTTAGRPRLRALEVELAGSGTQPED